MLGTIHATRLNHVISVSIDGVLKDDYVGNATTLPDVLQRAVLQQECRSSGCPSATLSAHSEDIQIDRITIENPA